MGALTISERIDMAQTALDEGRVIQGSWRRDGDGGRELVCALAAFGPDINGSGDCPADLMPQWLAELVPTLDDGVRASYVPAFMRGLVDRARKWSVLDADGWDRVRSAVLVQIVQYAQDANEWTSTDAKPQWQIDVEKVTAHAIAELDKPHTAEEKEAFRAWAAEAAEAARAAWAAWAAEAAEAARAAWAAEAARAARAARAAEAFRAWAAWAAGAARANTVNMPAPANSYEVFAICLFMAIDAEINAAA